LKLLDLRVLDQDGKGDEFAVLAALQFIRWLNANKDTPVVHGVNISMSLLHDVANFACGRTPVCERVRTAGRLRRGRGRGGRQRRLYAVLTAHGPTDGYRGSASPIPATPKA